MGATFALGPAVGGTLTTWFGWRSVFYVNIPLGVLALFGTYAWVRESRHPHARRLARPPGRAPHLKPHTSHRKARR